MCITDGKEEREKVNVFKCVPDRFFHHLLYPSVCLSLYDLCSEADRPLN